ncbi:hypothetical protein PoB_003009900 [Plakobranchus ocellatus]|uniref:Uncharacterized protein n=1 Tax=Plakobranchus ocellatus TaxID=259542 RepID=A0AAV4AAW3_9GAST|nr:hypothetical protein PoB_003009900 [Plakobranchus ocellatus]
MSSAYLYHFSPGLTVHPVCLYPPLEGSVVSPWLDKKVVWIPASFPTVRHRGKPLDLGKLLFCSRRKPDDSGLIEDRIPGPPTSLKPIVTGLLSGSLCRIMSDHQ